jgi:hypothetical protein
MRALGYRISKSDAGEWMLMRDPPAPPPRPAASERPALRLINTGSPVLS